MSVEGAGVTSAQGVVQLPKMDGAEVAPGIFLVGEPTPIPGTDELRCLANVGGALWVVRLRLRFVAPPTIEQP